MPRSSRLLTTFALVALLVLDTGGARSAEARTVFSTNHWLRGNRAGMHWPKRADLGEPRVDPREQFMQKMAEAEALMQQQGLGGGGGVVQRDHDGWAAPDGALQSGHLLPRIGLC